MESIESLRNLLNPFHNLNCGEKCLTLVLGLLSLCLVFFFQFRRGKGRKLPGPRGLPIVGYFPFLGSEPHKTFKDLTKTYGNIFRIYLGNKYVVVCNDWSALKDALGKTETLNRPPKIFDAIPNGLGFAGKSGPEWSEQRRFVAKAMKDNGFGRPLWEELVQESINEIVEEINSRNGEPIEVERVFASTFANNVMTLIFGHRFSKDDPLLIKISESMNYLVQVIPALDFTFFLPKLGVLLNKIGILKNDFSRIQMEVRKFAEGVKACVKNALKTIDNEEQESLVKTYYREVQNGKEKNLNNSFTDVSLTANIETLIIGGSDTTKSAFLFLVISMAKFPNVQDRVHKELDTVFGKDGSVRWADRTKVPYTFATIMESMRWFTLAPMPGLRMANENVSILGYDVPKGAYILSNFWALHCDPKYWPNPEKFEPERFLLDNGKQANFKADSFTPFSYGKRNCPGEMIAQMTIFLYFTTVVQKFKILPPEGESVKYDIVNGLTLTPQNVNLRFIPRD